MANYAQTSKNFTGQYMTGIQGINTGIIIPWTSTSLPSGFLECNGQSVSTTTYAALFAVVAYTYGGSGASFLLPDLQDKIVLSRSNNKALASVGGANTVVSTGNISGNLANATLTIAQLPAHTHTYPAVPNSSCCLVACPGGGGSSGMNPYSPGTPSGSTGGGGAHSHSLTANISGDATSVLQPYLTLMYIIKT
jgi:microcystin-dependent protein